MSTLLDNTRLDVDIINIRLLTVDNVNFYYNFKPEGDHEYTLVLGLN